MLPVPQAGSPSPTNQVEQASTNGATPLNPTQGVPVNPIPLTTPGASVNQASYQVADDKDVIEPEWVHKVKSIVTSTADDPYKQSEDLTALKADYMQKRYNKIIKLK